MRNQRVQLYSVVTTETFVKDIDVFVQDETTHEFMLNARALDELPEGVYMARGDVELPDSRLKLTIEHRFIISRV